MSLSLTKIKTKLFFVSNQKALSILDGAYRSLHFGRSLDFEDLREYQPGDSVKDIDWKHSAQSNKTYVKQHKTDKQIPVYFVVDTGKSMLALSYDAESTRGEVGLNTLNLLGHIALKHGDRIGVIFGDNKETIYHPAKSTQSHLEHIIENIENRYEQKTLGLSDIDSQIDFFLNRNLPSGIIVIISSNYEDLLELEPKLHLLNKRNTLYWVGIDDTDPTKILNSTKKGDTILDVESQEFIPDFIKKNKKFNINESFLKQQVLLNDKAKTFFSKNNIRYISMKSNKDIVTNMIELLKKSRRR